MQHIFLKVDRKQFHYVHHTTIDKNYYQLYLLSYKDSVFSKWHYLLLNFKKKQMIAGDIISEIIKRMKFWGSRFPDATTSFIPNTRGDSFYLIQNRGDNNLPVQIRLSNHGTYLETWTDRKELGGSVDRIDPTYSINISIVFVDNGKSITDDCEGQVNCEGCALTVCKPQTFAGQNEIGRPFKVYQYVYQSDTIAPRYINALVKSIFHARHSGEYIDPLKDLPRAAKPKEFDSTNMPQQKKSHNINKPKINNITRIEI